MPKLQNTEQDRTQNSKMKSSASLPKQGTDDVSESISVDQMAVSVSESTYIGKYAEPIATPNSKGGTLISPSKRDGDDVPGSPSVGKNKILKQEGMRQFSKKFNLLESHSSPPFNSNFATTIADLSLNQNNLNITVKLHHKFEPSAKGKVGKFLGFDKSGRSANIVFYEKTMKLFEELMEGQYVKIAYGKVKLSKKEYSLASSKYDIEMTDANNITIMEDNKFSIPFEHKSIKNIIHDEEIGGVFDCYGRITTSHGSVIDEASRFSFIIEDETADVEIIAFDENSKDTLKAAFGMEQKIFAFQRLKYGTFQDKPQLIFRDGSEVLTRVQNQQFESFMSDTASV